MKSVRKITEQNKRALLKLPAGFPIQMRSVERGNESDWENAYVVSVDAEGGRNGELVVVLSSWDDYGLEWYSWELTQAWSDKLVYGSGCTPASVRWSPEALQAFRALSDDLVLAQTVASLLVGAR